MTSIVIITFNQEEELQKTLPLLLEQQNQDFDICVVDKNSEDDTIGMLERMEETEPRLHHISLPKSAKGINKDRLAVMLGIRDALYDRIILMRAHCAPASPTWLSDVNTAWTDDKPILLLPELAGPKPSHKIRFAAWLAQKGHARWALGHVLGYSKQFFMTHGGFSTQARKKEATFNIMVRYFSNPLNTQILTDAKYSVHSVVS